MKIGAVIDHYRVEAVLGQGGMGRVYRALDTRLERQVALKVLLEGAGTNRDAAARLLREARAAAALDHPNAVAIYGVGEHDGAPYIAMELIRGDTLRACLERSPPPPREKVLAWLADVARALAAAHALGIVHRDVKPDNVMIRDDGRVKVLDFGIARRVDVSVDASAPTEISPDASMAGATDPLRGPSTTARGAVVGTLAYMAPEQVRGRPIDARADQFAWGVVAFEALSGARPWEHGDALALAAAIAGDPAPELGGVPEGLARIVGRALEKQPSGRFASMDDLVAALDDVATGRRSPDAPSPKPPPVTTRARRSSPARAVVPVVGVLAIAAGALLYKYAPREDTTAAATTGVVNAPSPPSAATAAPATAAMAAYTDALVTWRTRSELLAVDGLERAVDLDPDLAPAQLRYALFIFQSHAQLAREHLARAERRPAALDARDRDLLAATKAYVAEPPDLAGFERHLAKMVERDGRDTEALYWLSYAMRLRGEVASGNALLDRALAADPAFLPALVAKAEVKLFQDADLEGALATYDGCLERAPSAALCLGGRADVLSLLGRCDDYEKVARHWAATIPEHTGGYSTLAQSLAALGSPEESVVQALRASEQRQRPSNRADAELWNKTHVAIYYGRFEDGEKGLVELQQRFQTTRPDSNSHANVALYLAQLYLEMGRPADAGRVADELLRSAPGLPSKGDLPRFGGITFDHMVRVAAMAHQHGTLSKADYEARRDAWLTTQRKITKGDARAEGAIWTFAFLMVAETEEAAKDALGRGDLASLQIVEAYPGVLPRAGHAAFLAGRYADAARILKRYTSQCSPLEEGLDLGPALVDLGESLEKTGDAAGARAAYEKLLSRWGMVRPKSVSAERAKRRLAALKI